MIIPVAHPEWIDDGIKQFQRTIKLRKDGRLPENLLGWMIVVDCMRMLRSVYGDDLSTVAALRERVLADVQREQEAGNGTV